MLYLSSKKEAKEADNHAARGRPRGIGRRTYIESKQTPRPRGYILDTVPKAQCATDLPRRYRGFSYREFS